MRGLALVALVALACTDGVVIGAGAPRRFVVPTTPDAGEVKDCRGKCEPPLVCDAVTPGECGAPPGCAARDRQCGFAGFEACGSCVSPAVCDGAQLGRCGRPAECGASVCGIVTASTAAAFCGACPSSGLCVSGRCEPGARPFCWDDGARINAGGGVFSMLVPYVERGRLVFSLDLDRLASGDVGCSRHFGGTLGDYDRITSIDTAPLATSDFADVDPRTSCVPPVGVDCAGWVGPSQVRADGLEMFYDASYPCGDWPDGELYVSWRNATSEPWSRPVMLASLVTRVSSQQDNAYGAILLPDGRTILFGQYDQLWTAERPSDAPGDVRFGAPRLVDKLSFADAADDLVFFNGLSCDGSEVLFTVESPSLNGRQRAYAMPVSVSPLRFGAKARYEAVPDGAAPRRTFFAESPDCSALYVWSPPNLIVKRRVACP